MESLTITPNSLAVFLLQLGFVGGFLSFLLWREHKVFILKKDGMKGEATITKINEIEVKTPYAKIFYQGRATNGEPIKGADIIANEEIYKHCHVGDNITILYNRLNHRKNMPMLVVYDRKQHMLRRFLIAIMLFFTVQIIYRFLSVEGVV